MKERCVVIGCAKEVFVKRMCCAHYYRMLKHGHTDLQKKTKSQRMEEFKSRYLVNSKSGCHEWIGKVAIRGYPVFSIAGKQQLGHRLIWEHENGPIPDGMCICHKCDNRRCVNMDHLFLGTRGDNNRDMYAKKRNVKAMAKLTPEQVREIFYASGTLQALGKIYNISITQIWAIKRRREWRDVTCSLA